jgi:hypothetical protein
LLKHQQGLCFHHIMKVRAPPFLLRNSPRERTAHRERSFYIFGSLFGAHVRPKAAQGRPKEPKRNPKASPGTRKIHQKSTWDPTLVFKGAREAPGVPPERKMTPKSTKKTAKKASIPFCDSNIFGGDARRHSTQKRQAFRAVLILDPEGLTH